MPNPQNLANSSTEVEYKKQRDLLLSNLKLLPPTEMHYFFALLVASIENEPDPKLHTHLIVKANEVIKKLNQYYEDIRNQKAADLTEVAAALNELIISSKMHSTPHHVKMAILAIFSVVSGFIVGIVGAVSGFFAGLFSDYNVIGNLRGSGFGFATGLALGVYAGSRCPNVAFQSSFERKLEFCINSIEKVGKELPTKKSHAEYEAETKQHILDTFFKDIPDSEKENAFNTFLLSDNQKIQVCTTTAGFLSRDLKGKLGHHNLIAYSINGKQEFPMEYGDRAKTPHFFDQSESPRVITGKKLFDMLVLDRILQETYEYTVSGFLKDYDIGSNDCRTYIDKLLIGTGQAPTQLSRFNSENDKWIGTHVVGPLVRFFSKTQEQELLPLVKHYKKNPDDPDPVITARKWTGKKEHTSEESLNETATAQI